MYTLSVTGKFDSAHRLYRYEGKCGRLHGHTWVVTVYVSGEKLNQWGAVIDFKNIKQSLTMVLNELDHKTLLYEEDELRNVLPPSFVVTLPFNPTAENLAYYIYGKMTDMLSPFKVVRVDVEESPTTQVSFDGTSVQTHEKTDTSSQCDLPFRWEGIWT